MKAMKLKVAREGIKKRLLTRLELFLSTPTDLSNSSVFRIYDLSEEIIRKRLLKVENIIWTRCGGTNDYYTRTMRTILWNSKNIEYARFYILFSIRPFDMIIFDPNEVSKLLRKPTKIDLKSVVEQNTSLSDIGPPGPLVRYNSGGTNGCKWRD
jgi:hypothetical protein